jgi:hypothetical protein
VEQRGNSDEEKDSNFVDRCSAGGTADDHEAGKESHMLGELDQEGGNGTDR